MEPTKEKTIKTDDFIREALHNPEFSLNPEEADKLMAIVFENTIGDFPYDEVLRRFIHRIGADATSVEKFKGTEFEDIVLMLPILSKKLTEYQAHKD